MLKNFEVGKQLAYLLQKLTNILAMLSKRSDIGKFAILILFIIIQACSGMSQTSIEPYAGKSLFLQNNIHAQQGSRDNKASYANWTNPGTGHFILPVNSAVEFGNNDKVIKINDW